MPFQTSILIEHVNRLGTQILLDGNKRASYGQHGPKCRLQFTKNIGRGFKTQESQNHKIDAVPDCCPNSLVKCHFGRDHPPILERKKSLQNKVKTFQPSTKKSRNKMKWKKYEPRLSPRRTCNRNETRIHEE